MVRIIFVNSLLLLTDNHEREFEASLDAFSVDLIGQIGESDIAVELFNSLAMLGRPVHATAVHLRRPVAVHHVMVRGQLIGFAMEKQIEWLRKN